MKPKIIRLTNEHPDFYPTVGRLALDPEVIKNVLAPLSDEPHKVWWLAMQGAQVSGFCAAVPVERDGSVVEVRMKSLFVLAAARGQGIGRKLFDARRSYCEKTWPMATLTGTASENSLPMYQAAGFELGRAKGRFTVVTKVPCG